MTGLKIFLGTVLAVIMMLFGQDSCGGLYHLFSACTSLGFFLPPEPALFGTTFVAMGLLLWGLIDVFKTLPPIKLLPRDIEALADGDGDGAPATVNVYVVIH